MTYAILKKLGYNVVVAETPMDAIFFCNKEDTPIDLLVTDVIMPEMSGLELRDKIKAVRPDIKVIFMSGYTADVVLQPGVRAQDVHFIQKPFSMDNLARKIREVIEEK